MNMGMFALPKILWGFVETHLENNLQDLEITSVPDEAIIVL